MSLGEVLEALRGVGLATTENPVPYITDEPKIPTYLSFPTDQASKKYETKGSFGQGCDFDDTKARIKSLGECLERLCLYNDVTEERIGGRFQESDGFLDPAIFCAYSDEQRNRREFASKARDQEYLWYPAKDLVTGVRRLVPAQTVFLSAKYDSEFPIRPERISTGAALGPAKTQHAVHSGFLESIERDSCAPAYLMRKEVPRIEDMPQSAQDIIDYFSRYQLESHVFDMTTDLGVPTVAAFVLDRTGIGCAVNAGSRSSFTYDDAIVHALLEAVHCRRYSRLMKSRDFPEKLPERDEVVSMDHRFYFWHTPDRIEDLSMWLNTEKTVSYDELKRSDTTFEKALDRMRELGYHVLQSDITLPEIRDGGFEGVKVVIPELHPLYLDERAKMLHSAHYGSIKDDRTLVPHPFT